MAGFEQETIDRILQATDVVELVGAVVPLIKRSGDNLFGRCPFHKEKTPSFSVNRRRQIFHCFGCGESGNAIGWLMKYEKIAFPEAVRRLAERANIPLPKYRPTADDSIHEALYRLHDLAQQFFYDRLRDKANPDAKAAMLYLLNRGLTRETIDGCGIGLSPANWDDFAQLALREGHKLENLLASGLCGRSDAGKLYDRFRDRISFPIQNLSGRIVAFGGRVRPGRDDAAKYLNSPETAIYRKSEILYGLSWARDAIRKTDTAIVVEGYLDCISLQQFGIGNAIATSGTALTTRQARLMLRFAPKVFLVYDGDDAGRRAALRGGDVLIAEGLDVVVAFLPQGEDPDTFVQKFGAEAFQQLLAEGKGWLDHQLDHFSEQGMLATPSGSAIVLRELVRVLRAMQDKVQLEFWIKLLSQKIGITESIVRHELSRVAVQKSYDDPDDPAPVAKAALASPNAELEARIIGFMIRYREPGKHFRIHRDLQKYLRPAYFQVPALQALFGVFLDSWLENGELPTLEKIRSVAQQYEGFPEWIDEQMIASPMPPVDTDPFSYEVSMLDNTVRQLLKPLLENELKQLQNQLAGNLTDEAQQKNLSEQKRVTATKRKLAQPLYLGK
ncbi:MAG: DNA primase [bacterium]|nr:DNA primase [bacterium]